jgi:hypothetical protein
MGPLSKRHRREPRRQRRHSIGDRHSATGFERQAAAPFRSEHGVAVAVLVAKDDDARSLMDGLTRRSVPATFRIVL